MSYTVTTSYYNEPSIVDEYPTIDEAMDAYTDADWRACHAPRDIAGDIRCVTVKHNGQILRRSHTYP